MEQKRTIINISNVWLFVNILILTCDFFCYYVINLFCCYSLIYSKKATYKYIAWWAEVCNQDPNWETILAGALKSLCVSFQLLQPFLTRTTTMLTFYCRDEFCLFLYSVAIESCSRYLFMSCFLGLILHLYYWVKF